MSAIFPVFYLVLLAGAMLLGLLLLAIGIILLIKLNNKLAGGLTSAAGAVLTVFPVLIILAFVVTQRIQG